jgi:hypothetical protein
MNRKPGMFAKNVGTPEGYCYINIMTKAHAISTETIVRDSKSGRFIIVRGAGALKGHLTIQKGVDLTKPIASQAIKSAKGRKTRSTSIKP